MIFRNTGHTVSIYTVHCAASRSGAAVKIERGRKTTNNAHTECSRAFGKGKTLYLFGLFKAHQKNVGVPPRISVLSWISLWKWRHYYYYSLFILWAFLDIYGLVKTSSNTWENHLQVYGKIDLTWRNFLTFYPKNLNLSEPQWRLTHCATNYA